MFPNSAQNSNIREERRNLAKNIVQNVWVNGKPEAYGSTHILHIELGPTLVKKRMYQEKNEAIGIARKHNNGLRTFSYAIYKNLAMHQYDFTCKYLLKSMKHQCKPVPEEVKKTSESTKH